MVLSPGGDGVKRGPIPAGDNTMTNMTKAQLLAALEAAQAALAAQAATSIADEVVLDLSNDQGVQMDARAANFEPAARGSKLAKNPSVSGGEALKSCSHAPELSECIKTLNTLVAQFGPVFKRPAARTWLFQNARTGYGEFSRYTNELSVNTHLSGCKARILVEASDLVDFKGKPETWTVDMFKLAQLNEFLKLS